MTKRRPAHIEHLRQRALLSVSVVKETLNIEGTAGKDVISLSVHPQVINLMSVKVNGDEKVFLLGSFKVININTLGGNDMVRVGELYDGHPAYLNIDLGAGNDRAYGSVHAETLIGGTGNDRISAGAGNDYVNAGAGDDVVVGDAGNDTVVGLAGKDSLFGGDGADQLYSGDDDDLIDGGNETDVIDAGAGNDRVTETEAMPPVTQYSYNFYGYSNLINGGSGADNISVGPFGTRSSIFGGDGDDYLFQIGTGVLGAAASLFGEKGNDKLIGAIANGGDGNDTIAASGTAQIGNLDGANGDDHIKIDGYFNGAANGGAGDDVIECKSAYSVTLNGNDGNDRIDSHVLSATLNGGAGNDTLTANAVINGDAGDDLLRPASGYLKGFTTSTSYVLNAPKFFGGDGSDLLIGSAYSDTLKGDGGDDILQGGDASDSLEGGEGDDALFGGNETDTMHGNDGNDSLFAGGMNDIKRNDDGKDFAYGDEGEDYFDKESRWSETDRNNRDSGNFISASSGMLVTSGILGINSSGSVSYGATITNGSYYGSSGGTLTITDSSSYSDLLRLAQNYGSSISNPTTPTTPGTTVADDAISIYKNAAIFSGMFTTSSPSSDVQMPDLLAAERKAIRGQFVHVPSDWTLTRVGKKAGLVWYEVTLPDDSRAKVSGELRGKITPTYSYEYDYTTGSYAQQITGSSRPSVGTQNLVVSVMGVHSTSVLLFDVAAGSNAYSTWAAPASFSSSKSLVTRVGTSALFSDSGESFSINKPATDVLEGVSIAAGQRYLYTAQGLRKIDASGVGAIVA